MWTKHRVLLDKRHGAVLAAGRKLCSKGAYCFNTIGYIQMKGNSMIHTETVSSYSQSIAPGLIACLVVHLQVNAPTCLHIPGMMQACFGSPPLEM